MESTGNKHPVEERWRKSRWIKLLKDNPSLKTTNVSEFYLLIADAIRRDSCKQYPQYSHILMSLFVEDSIKSSFLLKDHIVKYIYDDWTIAHNFELVRIKAGLIYLHLYSRIAKQPRTNGFISG